MSSMKSARKLSVHYLTIEPELAGQRIDNFLITKLKGVPRTRIYRILRKGEVRVNKKRAAPSYRLESGDQVRIPSLKMRSETKAGKAPRGVREVLGQRILYEDKVLLIVNKPAGIAAHGGSGIKWGVVEILKEMYPEFP